MTNPESRDLLEQLLAEEATQGLSQLKTLELERLLEELGADRSDYGYEETAAALEVAFHAAQENEVPASVDAELGELAARASQGGDLLAFPTRQAAPDQAEESSTSTTLWLLAAAAAIAALAFAPRLFDSVGTPPVDEAAVVVEATDQLQLELSPTEDAAAASATGQVIWSTSLQEGEMRIAGLEANDPTVFQYQLWIFDAQQDERYPVDGGVFDVSGSEVTVPIDAKIAVQSPTLFAITVEKPGGVVVSDRERIVLVAPVA